MALTITNVWMELEDRVQRALMKSEATFVVPTADLALLLETYFAAQEEITDLEDEVAYLVREANGGD